MLVCKGKRLDSLYNIIMYYRYSVQHCVFVWLLFFLCSLLVRSDCISTYDSDIAQKVQRNVCYAWKRNSFCSYYKLSIAITNLVNIALHFSGHAPRHDRFLYATAHVVKRGLRLAGLLSPIENTVKLK